MRETECTLEA